MARISGVDLPREKRADIGLTYVYGIGRASALSILGKAGIDGSIRVKDRSVAWGGRPPCSQNARDETALARVKSASWRARDGRVKAMRAVEAHPAQAGESVTGRG